MARHVPRVPATLLRSSSHKPLATAIASALAALSGSALADVIAPDGRTGTTVNPLGAGFSEITTSSVKGRNAFNSFSHFQLDAGNTVNFVLPSGASTLVNLVTDSTAIINGTVNSVFEGRGIGGHLVFADPHGVVVGASGVLNVGSLLLTAPTQSLMDGLL